MDSATLEIEDLPAKMRQVLDFCKAQGWSPREAYHILSLTQAGIAEALDNFFSHRIQDLEEIPPSDFD